jgi:hypothetical protein
VLFEDRCQSTTAPAIFLGHPDPRRFGLEKYRHVRRRAGGTQLKTGSRSRVERAEQRVRASRAMSRTIRDEDVQLVNASQLRGQHTQQPSWSWCHAFCGTDTGFFNGADRRRIAVLRPLFNFIPREIMSDALLRRRKNALAEAIACGTGRGRAPDDPVQLRLVVRRAGFVAGTCSMT